MKIKYIDYGATYKPIRAHYNDAGLDCFANEDFTVVSGKTVVVGLGFGLEIPDGYMATIRPRSSLNIKGIITQIGTIGSGYKGEIKVVFINTNRFDNVEFHKGDKICQIVIEPVVIADLIEEDLEERGTGGFGSTGKWYGTHKRNIKYCFSKA